MLESDRRAVKEYIHLAAETEDAVARIYELFGGLFSSNVEFCDFWRLSAEAERYHAATIRLYDLVLADQATSEPARVAAGVDDTRALLTRLQAEAARLEHATPSMQEALDIAIHIEAEGSEIHGRGQFAFLFPALSDLFERLDQEDRAHRRTFEAARSRFAS